MYPDKAALGSRFLECEHAFWDAFAVAPDIDVGARLGSKEIRQ